jgi:type I restriction enzyme S subunit
MNIQVLLEKYFDVAFAAPNGVKKLRELILSLAMQGKLVAQDPHDVPASMLLKEIEAEKNRLVKDGKIKPQKLLPKISLEEIPYALPNEWLWVRMDDLCLGITSGSTPPNHIFSDREGVPFLKVYNIRSQKIDFQYKPQFISEEYHLKQKRSCLKSGDVVMNIVGPPLGKVAIIPDDFPEYNCNQAIVFFRPIIASLNKYLYSYLLSGKFLNKIDLIGTAGQDNISITKSRTIPVPLPPLAEQRRIVAKIDELMARCDELEKLRGNLNHKQITVHKSALNRLLTANDQSDFNTAWQFITQHFGDLYSVKENVAELRKAILQLAVMGKLVPQDPSDRPASELLKEIEKEKERLVKEGKIKKSKPLPEIQPDESPYELPKGWKWVRFFTVNTVRSELVSARDFPAEKQIAPDSIEKGSGKLLTHRTVEEFGAIGPNNRFYKGQILYSKIRPSLSKAVIAPYSGLCSADMYPIETFIDVNFMLKTILSEIFLEQVRKAENRVKMPKLNLESLGIFQIALPPLAEQHRIVAKCDQLMTLCDNLEKQIDNSNSKKTNLLNAVMTKV